MQRPLPLCKEDCMVVKEQFCYNDWAHIEDNKKRGIFFQSKGHFELPDCDTLPNHKIVNNNATCSYAKLMDVNETEVTCKKFNY